MGDSAKDGSSGEIFSGKEQSAYQEAMQAPEEDLHVREEPYQQTESQTEQPGLDMPPPPDGQPPPPFVEDNRKKFLFIFIFIIFIVVVGLFAFSLVRGRGQKPQETEKITLNYWGLWEEPEVMRPVFDEYTAKNPHITVNYQRQDPVQYRERLTAAIDRDEGPDIFRFHNTWLPMLANHLDSLPNEIYSAEEFAKMFYPVAVKDLKSGDNFYGLPLEIDGLVLFYNTDILEGANVAIPKTWVDVQNAVSKLTVKEENRIVTSSISLGTAENIAHFSDILGLMLLQNGTVLSKSLFSCADSSTVNCGVEALTFYRKFADEPNNTWDLTLENSLAAFAGGKTAMMLAPSWQAITVNTMNPDLNFKTAQVPQLPCDRDPCPGVNWASYWVEGVSAKSVSKDEAWKLLKFLTQPETMRKLYAEQVKMRKLSGEPYSRVEMGKELSDNPYVSSVIASAPSMRSFYLASQTYDGETGINTSLITYLKDAVNSLEQGSSSETALKTAESGFDQVLIRFGLKEAPPEE